MNKKLVWVVVVVVVVVALSLYFLGQFQRPQDVTTVVESGSTLINEPALRSTIDQMPVESLSDAEKEGILYMREEEKLAHDVYLTLYEQWNLPIFDNIARSEQTHTYAVKTLIDKYGLVDPATTTIGTFSNPEIQELYDNLVNEGSTSLQEALEVGAAIEEIDILDLEEYIAETDNEDIKLVYENLLKGSRNHLRAFVSTIKRQGYDYAPQYLSQDKFDAIISSPIERGRT
jgi:hypothetical protein